MTPAPSHCPRCGSPTSSSADDFYCAELCGWRSPRALGTRSIAEGPFTVREGSPGGARECGDFRSPVAALNMRDTLRDQFGGRLRVFDVIGRDTDPPETGEVEWCAGDCGAAVLTSAESCENCEAGL